MLNSSRKGSIVKPNKSHCVGGSANAAASSDSKKMMSTNANAENIDREMLGCMREMANENRNAHAAHILHDGLGLRQHFLPHELARKKTPLAHRLHKIKTGGVALKKNLKNISGNYLARCEQKIGI